MIAAAQIGMVREDVDTPVLLLDLDIMEQNIAAMADLIRRSPVALRPHAKTHKTPIIAHNVLNNTHTHSYNPPARWKSVLLFLCAALSMAIRGGSVL